MPARLTGDDLYAASRRAASSASEVRWLVRAYLEFVFEGSRDDQSRIASRLTQVARRHPAPTATFAAYAVEGSLAMASDASRPSDPMGEAFDLFASARLGHDPLWAELAALFLCAVDRVDDALEVIAVALRAKPLGAGERQRLHCSLGNIELAGGHSVAAAAALLEASLPIGMVDDRRSRWATSKLEQLERAALAEDLSEEELRVVAAAAEGLTPAQTAHRLAISVRSVEFYRGLVREKLTARHRSA